MMFGDPIHELRCVIGAGSIRAYRVSAARLVRCQRTGFSHPYWGVAVYAIMVDARGRPVARCIRPARRDRASRQLAERDARRAAKAIGGVVIRRRHGVLTPAEAADVLAQLGQTAPA